MKIKILIPNVYVLNMFENETSRRDYWLFLSVNAR